MASPAICTSGFKVANDTRGPEFDPTNGDRKPSSGVEATIRAFVSHRFPALRDAPVLGAEVCQCEQSPDGHFIIDRHPAMPDVWIAGGGGGHGFKMGPVLGEDARATGSRRRIAPIPSPRWRVCRKFERFDLTTFDLRTSHPMRLLRHGLQRHDELNGRVTERYQRCCDSIW